MLLCNESFSSTNEREGSEIGRQVATAMIDSGVKLIFVTHHYDLAHELHASGRDDILFLRAPRGEAGRRRVQARTRRTATHQLRRRTPTSQIFDHEANHTADELRVSLVTTPIDGTIE